ncbi:DUF1028 domain-containing protein [Candidatus Bathyarchaeota archaeon]|nr:DUF1028 domain-containing protein [Candidatus Bathyarchaeota archaeon]
MRLKYCLNNGFCTFSMVARCPRTLALGVCVASASLAVGSAVPHVEAGVGAIAVQGYTCFFHGVNGLKLLKNGLKPNDVLKTLLENDDFREMRQISIVDVFGEKAAFTGRETLKWSGHIIREDCVAAGNALTSGKVLESMVKAFENSEGEWFPERLLRALEAGQETGGDWRGICSAALVVVEREPIHESRPKIDLRVDLHDEPVRELRRIFESYKRWMQITR